MQTNTSSTPLWTKNFTIITLGTVVSMLGSSMSGFAISLMVLDYTRSTFLYTLFMVVYALPSVFFPLLAGPYLDRYSRKKVIYILDFISAAIYIGIYLLIKGGYFNYGFFLMLTFLIGAIDGVYRVAFDSLYPNLVDKENYTKAYSVESIIYPLSTCMVPVASFIYYNYGSSAPIFLINAFSFLVAAVFETQIDYREQHISAVKTKKGIKSYRKDFIEGIQYLKNEKGLMSITLYFSFNALLGCATYTLGLPFFKNNPELFKHIDMPPATLFSLVNLFGIAGRFIGGTVQYKFKYPAKSKFAIALFVYVSITILDATALYLPVILMSIFFFFVGLFGVTSYNIRISATQSYITDNKRARFTGVFNMGCTFGTILGQLSCGALAEVCSERLVVLLFGLLNLVAVYFFIYRNREDIKHIYNREV